MLLPPNSKPQSIDAFCVEQGRWRPSQDGLAFKANPGLVAGTSLKRAIQSEKSQARVWQEVARADAKAAAIVAPVGGVASARLSTTGTYNASAENQTVNRSRESYVTALQPSIGRFRDAVGLVAVVNGRMTAADVYASPALFEALSGKLLASYALEALLARERTQAVSAAPSKQQISTFLSSAASGPAASETIGSSMHRSTRESKDAVMYEYAHVTTVSQKTERVVVHKSYLTK
jgi:hypothetical protein